MKIEIRKISDPVDGYVEVSGNYIPDGETCKCKRCDFSYTMPQSTNLEYIKATIEYLIKKG